MQHKLWYLYFVRLSESEIIRLIREHFRPIQGIYLYGSTTGNNVTALSDIDLALLSEKEIPETVRFEFAQKIAVAA